jgi:protocatechuate 3,4-dioxygenase beta subunit
MGIDRRVFLGRAGAIIGCTLGGSSLAEAGTPRGGRTPITRKEWDAIIGSEGRADFTCIKATEATEGPFYYESSPLRRDITDRRPGEKLRLRISVGGVSMRGCYPLPGAIVDIWQTDPTGLYSNVGLDLQPVDTSGQFFLRGHQISDEKGYVEFDTVVPGWEIVAAAAPVLVARRTTHIHVKVFHERQLLTTQLFFPDPLIDQIYADMEPYKSHVTLTAPGLDRSYARIRNGDDRFFNEMAAKPMVVERINGVLTATAVLGLLAQGNRGFAPYFR